MPRSTLYDRDFHAWASEQAALLRERRLGEADIEHIAEEIESMGKTERRELVSRLRVLLLHLLKWQLQPAGRCSSWRTSVIVQRNDLADHLDDNPSLRAFLPEALSKAYRNARLEAAEETKLPLSTFPSDCPYSIDEIASAEFWPEAGR